MPFTYILQCADGSYYTGSTWDISKRFQDHQDGLGCKYTKTRLPVKLIYCEEHDRIEDAYHREKQIQGWSRKKKQALIAGDEEQLKKISRSYTQFRNNTREK
jgi:putative endonuclease